MNAQAGRTRLGLPLVAGLLAIVLTFAGSASINDRNATRAARVEPAAQVIGLANELHARTDATLSNTEDVSRTVLPGGATTRLIARCANCGVVESVRRIRRREIAAGACSVPGSSLSWMNASAHDSCGVISMAMHEVSVEDMLAGRGGAGNIVAPPSYQIVVRFRDGSRRVLHEGTGRALQVGDRVQVIAGIESPAS